MEYNPKTRYEYLCERLDALEKEYLTLPISQWTKNIIQTIFHAYKEQYKDDLDRLEEIIVDDEHLLVTYRQRKEEENEIQVA